MSAILFVCHRNICRSIMAEMILRDMLSDREDITIDSCATSTEEIGNGIYPATQRCLQAHGVPVLPHSARQITPDDYECFDYILCMEEYNIRNLRRVLGEAVWQQDHALKESKIRRLLDRDVADPWYTCDFEPAYRDIVEGCRKLASIC